MATIISKLDNETRIQLIWAKESFHFQLIVKIRILKKYVNRCAANGGKWLTPSLTDATTWIGVGGAFDRSLNIPYKKKRDLFLVEKQRFHIYEVRCQKFKDKI